LIRINPASHDHGFVLRFRGIVAFVRDSDDLLAQSESEGNLGGAGKERTNSHDAYKAEFTRKLL
jgi:hypothetical protein